MKNLGKRPKCPECFKPNPMSNGPHWKCKCGRIWVKKPRPHKVIKDIPAKCKHCGAEDSVFSHGSEWYCKICGRWWLKHLVGKKLDERPLCPDCSNRPMSSGFSWVCGKCGKCWKKEYRREPKMNYSDLISAKVIEI